MNLPACKDGDCRFTSSGGMTTCMYYPPVYNKEGINLNPDMNSTVATVSCTTCKKNWNSFTRGGKTTFTEITDDAKN